MLKTQKIDYYDGEILLEGYYAYDEKAPEKKPAILISHDWSGKNEFACQKANRLAELGYVGFALDMFGKGKMGKTKEEKMALIQPLLADRPQLSKRILAALTAVKQLDVVDSARIGAIGFCFGGLCVLDLARSGANMNSVVSFHGLLNAPETPTRTIKAKILALHGYNDPMVTPDQVVAFADEMTAAHANWELNIYGNTMHAFTNPEAHDSAFGTVYDKQADNRSWLAMCNFFKETL
ncbi:MAG TPA: dienelactone hydrolase family protein [Gammaproteobacteria bacterium]|jgi:dienelactone hydrolase|nr:dienelactone hydrolase family protein [Gammaproteobacteria bacterium]